MPVGFCVVNPKVSRPLGIAAFLPSVLLQPLKGLRGLLSGIPGHQGFLQRRGLASFMTRKAFDILNLVY